MPISTLGIFNYLKPRVQRFEAFAKTPEANAHDNFRTHTSIYINSAKLNQHLMKGTFKEGLQLIPW